VVAGNGLNRDPAVESIPNMIRIGIGPSTFAQEDKTPLDLLRGAGVTVVPNPTGKRLNEAETMAYLTGERLDGLLAGLEPLNRRVLESARPQLKAVARVGIGITNVDTAACADLGIRFSFTPDGPTDAVAEMTLTALLAMARNLEPMNRAMHAGQWPKSIGRSLRELTVLVVGMGRIGRSVAKVLGSMGCTILACDPFLPAGAELPGRRVELLAGLAEADAVTLHASGDKPLLTDAEFKAARPGLMVLNSARGELVDEAALIRALDGGMVSKAWFDAFWQEPYSGPLLQYPQVLLTPHTCTYTRLCRLEMETQAVRNLLRDLGVATR
jgi:D-3-phosphoglycerate dehydrogenase / 2-oxoglutarate reductase